MTGMARRQRPVQQLELRPHAPLFALHTPEGGVTMLGNILIAVASGVLVQAITRKLF